MAEMIRKRERTGSKGSMSRLDASALYALTRMCQPKTALETGSFRGMSTTFILKGMQDAGVAGGKVFSIDNRPDCGIGMLIPDELKGGFISLVGEVKSFLQDSRLPQLIDLFLHDSTHRYQFQRWEFESFWLRIGRGGLLVSHDVDMNASFVDFVSGTYAHDERGYKDSSRTSHVVWGRIGLLGFLLKA